MTWDIEPRTIVRLNDELRWRDDNSYEFKICCFLIATVFA